MNTKKSRKVYIITAFLLLFLCQADVSAAENIQLVQKGVKEEEAVVYLESDNAIEQVECQIGMFPCETIDVTKILETGISYHTIFLIDNSLSITEENREKAMSIVESYIDSKDENEYISIATFGESIEFLAEKSTDITVLENAIQSIQQENQDTYLTDVLFGLLDGLDIEEYTRFVVISDGVDNKAIGITKEELTEKLKKNTHPIYAVGHIFKNNEAELENMFALARATNGKAFLLDEEGSVENILEGLKNTKNVVKVNALIPEEVKDGGIKAVLLKIKVNGAECQIKTEMEMPFSVKEESAIVEEKTEPITETIVIEETTPEPVEITEPAEKEKQGNNILTMFAAVLAIVAAVLLLLKNQKGQKKRKRKRKQRKEKSAHRNSGKRNNKERYRISGRRNGSLK